MSSVNRRFEVSQHPSQFRIAASGENWETVGSAADHNLNAGCEAAARQPHADQLPVAFAIAQRVQFLTLLPARTARLDEQSSRRHREDRRLAERPFQRLDGAPHVACRQTRRNKAAQNTVKATNSTTIDPDPMFRRLEMKVDPIAARNATSSGCAQHRRRQRAQPCVCAAPRRSAPLPPP